ncbi:MAG: response regulator transcription factor [Planctomycetota bacterium]
MRILVVEDEPKVAGALREGLEREDFEVAVALTGEDGFFRLHEEGFDLVILDLMLPGRSGLEILKTMRQRGLDTPVLVLTARDTVEDRVIGLDTGADDYLVKPFAFAELVARVRALLRRNTGEESNLHVGALQVDRLARTVALGDEPVELTHREFELLEFLMRHAGHVVSREMLARDVWKETMRATPLDNVIDVHIARLRRKIDHGDTRHIHTVRGVGFVLRAEDA